jgi:hypothetical protein
VRQIIKDNLGLVKAAPLRSLFGFVLLLPAFSFSLSIIILLVGMAGEFFLTLLFYGLSGLDRHVQGGFYQDIARYCIAIFEFFIPFGSMGLKIFLLVPYSLAAAFLLISAHKYVEKKQNVE